MTTIPIPITIIMNNFSLVIFHRKTYSYMKCMNYPEQNSSECKYGYRINECNKKSCLKGPDELCNHDSGRISEQCAENLRCSCGFCDGCDKYLNCSKKICDFDANNEKRTSSRPIWFTEYYQQHQDEKRRLQRIQQKERQRQQYLPSPRDFLNYENSIDRLSHHPINNNFEYSNNDD